MQVQYLYPHWGSENLSVSKFLNLVIDHQFDGVEINLPEEKNFETDFHIALLKIKQENPNFVFVLQQVRGLQKETPNQYLDAVIDRLQYLAQFKPDFINSHTGKDHYSFDDNCKIIDAIESFSEKTGIPVYHEIHRGRFTFHSQATLKYLDRFPKLQFVGDFSHWCVVSESLLHDQEEAIQKIIPHIAHLHARVGTEQASQVSNPFAPEWSGHLERFTQFWKDTLKQHSKTNKFTITPEFGPYPYMPQAPFTKEPMVNQQEVNIKMRDYLKTKLP